MFSSTADYHKAIKTMPPPNRTVAQAARRYQDNLTKPPGALGRLEDLAVFMASWHGTLKPQINTAPCLIFAGNHGIATLGVSAFPPEVTQQMVANFARGGAAINQLAQAADATLQVIALDLDTPTADFTQGAALTETETLDAMSRGADALPQNADIVLVGEMGIGNSTAAAAVSIACLEGACLGGACPGGTIQDWIGPGTGVDAKGMQRKAQVVTQGLAANAEMIIDGLGIMQAFAGREMAAIAGAVLAARMQSIPVLLDGYIATAAALPLFKDNASALDHTLISHRSKEPGHGRICDRLNKAPLLDLGMRLGEGSGAATALPLVRAALAAHNGMASFAEAGVSEKNASARRAS